MQDSDTSPGTAHQQQTIREAGPDDFQVVMQLLEDAFRESRYTHLAMAKVRLSKLVKSLLRPPPSQRIFLALNDGVPVGLIGGTVSPYIFADALTATVQQIYLRPEARASRLALDMIEAFAAWAKAQGALEVTVHMTGGPDADRVGTFLSRHGFTHTGGNFFRTL